MDMRKATLIAPTTLLAGAMMLPVGVTAASAAPTTHAVGKVATEVTQPGPRPGWRPGPGWGRRGDYREGWRDGYRDGEDSKRDFCRDRRSRRSYDNYDRRGSEHYRFGYRRGWDEGWRDYRCRRW